MEISIEALFKYLNFFWSHRKTKNGFFLGILLLAIIINLFAPINTLATYWKIFIYLILFIIAYIIWLFISGRRLYPSKKLKIAFALKSTDPSSQKIIDSTNLRIKDKLNTLNILNHFRFYEIGTDIFETNEQAENFILKRKINLIIHGTVYGGKVQSSYRYDLKNFFYTYNILNAPKDSPVWTTISKDIDLMCSNRNWIIDESNDLNDIIGVSNNLFEIILSIIAIGLTRSKNTIDYSILLIEKLLPILEKKIDPERRKIYLSKDKTLMKIPIDLLRTGRLRGILNGCYVNVARIYTDDGDFSKAIQVIEKGIKAGAEKIDCYPVLAISHYYLGDIEKAEEYTDKINNLSIDHPVYLVNKAFFSIQRKEYTKVTEYYDKLRKKINDDNKIIIEHVISFISERMKEDKAESAYLYVIGILNYNFINKKNGSSTLSKFIKSAGNKSAYASMIKIAKQLSKKNSLTTG